MPLPNMMSTIPSRRAQTPDSTLIIKYPFALYVISMLIMRLYGQTT
jgi:hypothetical protein